MEMINFLAELADMFRDRFLQVTGCPLELKDIEGLEVATWMDKRCWYYQVQRTL